MVAQFLTSGLHDEILCKTLIRIKQTRERQQGAKPSSDETVIWYRTNVVSGEQRTVREYLYWACKSDLYSTLR